MTEKTIAELLDDPSFRAWVYHSDPEAAAYWETWISADPVRRQVADEAARLLHDLNPPPKRLDEAKIQRNWKRLQASIASQTPVKPKPAFYTRPAIWAVAASVLLLIGSVVWFWPPRSPYLHLATAQGEVKTFTLPDGTTLSLNGNSHLRYRRAPSAAAWTREVWLEGEAFFDVTTTPDRQRFVVHAGDMQVEVLGTRFNVRNRSRIADVVLEEGKVKMHLLRDEASIDTTTLKPGERASVLADGSRLQKQQVEVATFTAWREHTLVWDGLSIRDALFQLEDSYGWHIIVADSLLLQDQLHGQLPLDDPEMVIEVLGELFQAAVIRQGDTLRFVETPR